MGKRKGTTKVKINQKDKGTANKKNVEIKSETFNQSNMSASVTTQQSTSHPVLPLVSSVSTAGSQSKLSVNTLNSSILPIVKSKSSMDLPALKSIVAAVTSQSQTSSISDVSSKNIAIPKPTAPTPPPPPPLPQSNFLNKFTPKSLLQSPPTASASSKSSKPQFKTPEVPQKKNCKDDLKRKDKEEKSTSNKRFAGINEKSVRTMWEQYDQHGVDITSEACIQLADDVSYRLWSFCNDLKPYITRTGGKLTTDLVNNALKDADIAPILGCGDATFDEFTDENNQSFYFQNDNEVDLREEYVKELPATSNYQELQLDIKWISNKKKSRYLNDLADNLIGVIFSGSEDDLKFGLETIYNSSHIQCIIRPLLHKSLEMLIIDYTDVILDRTLKLLDAIVQNQLTGNVMINDYLSHLVSIFLCLLFGPLDLNQWYQNKEMNEKLNNISRNLETSIDTIMLNSSENYGENAGITDQSNPISINLEENDINCDAILEMIETSEIKQENWSPTSLMPNSIDMLPECSTNQQQFNAPNNNNKSHEENEILINCKPIKLTDQPDPDKFSPVLTAMCSDEYVPRIYTLIGRFAHKWDFFEKEIFFVLSKRLDIYFNNFFCQSEIDYTYITRGINVLYALGDHCLKYVKYFFKHIDTLTTPEWIQNYFSPICSLIKGNCDQQLYEWLYDLCGDSLMPFMTHFTGCCNVLLLKYVEYNTKRQIIKIIPKISMRIIPKSIKSPLPSPDTIIQQQQQQQQQFTVFNVFEDYHVIKKPRKIGFKFSGCSPVKSKKQLSNCGQQLQQDEIQLNRFNEKIVICGKKLLGTLIYHKLDSNLLDHKYLTI